MSSMRAASAFHIVSFPSTSPSVHSPEVTALSHVTLRCASWCWQHSCFIAKAAINMANACVLDLTAVHTTGMLKEIQ